MLVSLRYTEPTLRLQSGHILEGLMLQLYDELGGGLLLYHIYSYIQKHHFFT